LTCNGTIPLTLKTLHGQFEFKVQRFIEWTSGAKQDITYFDLTDQFQENYISNRLKEFSAYYSNRLSYEDVAGLVERVTGSRQLSDQKIRQVVVNKVLTVSQAARVKVEELLEDKTKLFPKIQDKVDLYDGQSREILVFEEAIQVHGQKDNRQRKQLVRNKSADQDEAKDQDHDKAKRQKAPAISTEVVRLEKRQGGFEYITAMIDDQGNEQVPLPEMIKSQVLQEYREESKPLPMVAITDGAKKIQQDLLVVFGVTLVIILDWYHLGKRVRELMSMIALTKEDKRKHLKFIFYHLWRGQVHTVVDYLKTEVNAKNEAKLKELVTYIDKHRDEIIDYRRRKKAGKPVGSGYVEKGCDQVIGRRQKKKGMSWREVGSRSLGILKVAELNNRWEELWFPKEAANDPSHLPLASNL
jgi:hypothetical protein